jgi:DUF4097 and DUF4098 domain-containing protein YvlB
VCALAVLPAMAGAATDRQARTVALPPTRTLSLEITNGDVRIEGSARTDAAIEIVRHAPSEQGLERIAIQIEESDAHVRVRALQANQSTDAKFRSDVVLRVPHGAHLTLLRVMEGQIAIANFDGAIDADIRRGSIVATEVSGTLRLESGIGNVIVERAILSDNGLLRLRAFNGDVRLVLAERPQHARVMALALNGTIASDIPLTMKDTWGPRWGEATLGRGHPVISIDIITGKIEIKSP